MIMRKQKIVQMILNIVSYLCDILLLSFSKMILAIYINTFSQKFQTFYLKVLS